jgi:hypothetical protein
LLQAWAVLRGQVPRSSVWALSSSIAGDDADRARMKLHAFAQALPVPGTSDVQAQRPPDLAGSQP